MDKHQMKARMNEAYQNLMARTPQGMSLTSILTLSQITDGFTPHQLANPVEGRVAAFAQQYGIWLADRGEHYNTMTAYLHPNTSDEERLYILGAYYAILFFIDDVMGNEFRPEMTAEEAAQADREMEALLNFVQTGKIPEQTGKLLPPIMDVMNGFNTLGQADWVKHFLDFTRDHLDLAVQDLDSSALGETLTIDKYVELRNHVSGMYPAILMMEFAEDNYLPRPELAATGLQEDITRLEYLCAAIGGLVNDFFSFEKEVIEAESDFNLIPVMMMNYDCSLDEAIHLSAEYCNTMLEEYDNLAASVRERARAYQWGHIVEKHIDAMDACNQAVWVWQMETERYRRDSSLFTELQSQSPAYEHVERMQWLTQ